MQCWVMQRIICVLQLTKHCYPFKDALLCPSLPTQSQEKLHVLLFNIVCGGRGEARQVKWYSPVCFSGVCMKSAIRKVQICPKTFLHDCRKAYCVVFRNKHFTLTVSLFTRKYKWIQGSRYNNLTEYFFRVYRGGKERIGGDEEAAKFDFIEFGFTQ